MKGFGWYSLGVSQLSRQFPPLLLASRESDLIAHKPGTYEAAHSDGARVSGDGVERSPFSSVYLSAKMPFFAF